MRAHAIGVFCIVVLALAGCAKKDLNISRVEGSEPQRLSFGQPQAVKAAFAQKMQACWFSGTYPLLGGYRYDTNPALIQAADGPSEVQQIVISSGQSEEAQVFLIQFSPFNENTLIATRNISFPQDLATRMKRDVETWIFGGNECGGAAPSYTQPAVIKSQQHEAKPQSQQASTSEPVEDTGNLSVSTPSTPTLSRSQH